MANRNGAKGKRWENAVVEWFEDRLGKRLTRSNHVHEGDLVGLSQWVIECKDDAQLSPQAMVEQAERDAVKTAKPFHAVVRKSRGKPTNKATVIMSIECFASLLEYIEALQEEL